MKNYYRLGATALIAISAQTSVAEEAATASNQLEEMIVTSSRVPTPLRQIGTSVSVITASDIEQLGYNSLYNVLRTQPGVGASNQGGPGGITSLRIRGEESYRTRFYLDGIDISDTSSPQTTPRVEQILSTGVDRVEILRGPQGLMYGADAGGVVNISSAAPSEGVHGSLAAELGRYDSEQYSANLNGGNGTFDYSLFAANYDSDQFNARTTDTDIMDDDGYNNTTVHGRLGWNVNEDLRLSLVARDVEGETAYDGCFTVDTFASSNACTDEFEQEAWRAAVNYSHGQLTHELFYSSNEITRDNFTEGLFSFGLAGELERSGYLGSFNGGDALKLVYGVDLLTESLDDDSGESRDQEGYYLEYQGAFAESVFLTAGLRYDDNDDFGSTTTYRFSGAYLIPVASGDLKLRATYGTSFRAPSLFEIATNASEFTGPPAQGFELSEEEGEGFDLGVSWTNGTSMNVELVYFDQNISNEIFYDFSSFGYLQESGDTESQGIELFGQWDIASVSLSGNYTYTDSQDIDGNPRARRPQHLANFGITWTTLSDRLTVGLHTRLSHDAEDVDGTDLDDYEVLDLNANYNILEGLDIYGRIENLTDEDYEEVPTYNVSGAAGYVGLRYTF